ncbi:hypothetical protein K8I28_16685 [bacterium]|nr:hypothetical protein [bacterium]
MNEHPNPKIAIHKGDPHYHARWMERCTELGLEAEYVNAFDDNIIQTLKSFNVFLWRWSFREPMEVMEARSILAAAESMGLKVFPNLSTCYHYDDKIAQKYLLEASGAPFIPTRVFYKSSDARKWLEKADFPMIFKLKAGASSTNVKMVHTAKEALTLVDRAFGQGFSSREKLSYESSKKFKKLAGEAGFFSKLKKIKRGLKKHIRLRQHSTREKGYIYFQDFMPDNNYDTRIVVIGERAWAFRRHNRENDFRASGSGNIDYTVKKVDLNMVKIAFEVSQKCSFQCMAYDFLYDKSRNPLINEISYTFVGGEVIHGCPGYWDSDLNFHEGNIYAEDAILESLLSSLKQ